MTLGLAVSWGPEAQGEACAQYRAGREREYRARHGVAGGGVPSQQWLRLHNPASRCFPKCCVPVLALISPYFQQWGQESGSWEEWQGARFGK